MPWIFRSKKEKSNRFLPPGFHTQFMTSAVIIDGMRSPFGNFGGFLRDISPADLAAHVVQGAIQRSGLPYKEIKEIIIGNVLQTNGQSAYLARHAGLKAGMDMRVPALTVNRLCGSGLEAVSIAAANILLGHTKTAVAGGVEVMSQVPHATQAIRRGVKMGNLELEDMLTNGLFDGMAGVAMGGTAENLALDYQISREKQDEWALISQTRAEQAREAGYFAEEIAPLEVSDGREMVDFTDDEFIKGAAVKDKLPRLKPAFQKEGTVTPGNSSGINDGASAMVVTSEDYAKENSLKPLARIKSWATAGCRPDRMGLGPAFAIPLALERAGIAAEDVDLYEINEAFAAQFLAVKEELDLDPDRTNVNGGAIALGHPLGASGNRVLLTLIRELQRRKKSIGVASLCIGGGQGIAMVVEAM